MVNKRDPESAAPEPVVPELADALPLAEIMDADRTELHDLAGKNAPLEAKLKAEYEGWAERVGVLDWAEVFPRLQAAWGLDDPSG